MLTAFSPMLFVAGLLEESTEAWFGGGPHLLRAFRLTGALLVATLVPLLIDRRARHH